MPADPTSPQPALSGHQPPLVAGRIRALTYAGRPEPVLAGIDLHVHPGERILVLGTSGAGKTALVRLLAGLVDTPSRGGLVLDVAERAVVLEDPSTQVVAATCAEDVAAGLEARGVDPAQMHEIVAWLFERVGLAARSDDSPSTLSGGERQRLVVAAALAPIVAAGEAVQQRSLILLDEPVSQLDFRHREAVMELLDEPPFRRCAVVRTSADPAELTAGWRTIALAQGRIVHDGPPLELARRPAVLEQIGLSPPDPTRVAIELADRGAELPDLPLSDAVLLHAIGARMRR